MTDRGQIAEDDRPIHELRLRDDTFVRVGDCGVTRIVPYKEDGGPNAMLWFRVEIEGVTQSRFNGLDIAVVVY